MPPRSAGPRTSGRRKLEKADAAGTPRPHRVPAKPRAFAIKAEMSDPGAVTFTFAQQKTMYGGKQVAVGDTIYLFASENEGGSGLIAVGLVVAVAAVPPLPGVERQTPRVSLTIRRTARARRRLGRAELKPFTDWNDGRPESELNFKYYRQATNKVVGLSETAAEFLHGYFVGKA